VISSLASRFNAMGIEFSATLVGLGLLARATLLGASEGEAVGGGTALVRAPRGAFALGS
jgi:hypothetical protein